VKYLLLIYGNHEAWTAMGDNFAALDAAHKSLIAELTASGELIETNELDGEHSRIVRRDGNDELLVTEGPFVEAREIVGGYYRVDCVDLDRAVEIAGKLEETRFSLVDVRPIVS
jgi:hypothetical protein